MKMENEVFLEIRGILEHIKYYGGSRNKLHTKSITHTRLSRNSHKYQAK